MSFDIKETAILDMRRELIRDCEENCILWDSSNVVNSLTSSLRIAQNSNDPNSELKIYSKLGKQYLFYDLKKAGFSYREALTLALDLKQYDDAGEAILYLAKILTVFGNFAGAIQFYEQYESIRLHLTNPIRRTKILAKLSESYLIIGDYSTAIEYSNLMSSEMNNQISEQEQITGEINEISESFEYNLLQSSNASSISTDQQTTNNSLNNLIHDENNEDKHEGKDVQEELVESDAVVICEQQQPLSPDLIRIEGETNPDCNSTSIFNKGDINYHRQIWTQRNNSGIKLYTELKFEEASNLFAQNIRYAKFMLKDFYCEAESYENLGLCLIELRKPDQAANVFEKYLKLGYQFNNRKIKVLALFHLYGIYQNKCKYYNSVNRPDEYFTANCTAMDYLRERIYLDQNSIDNQCDELIEKYKQKTIHDDVVVMNKNLVKKFKNSNCKKIIMNCYLSMGDAYFSLKLYNRAIDYYSNVKTIADELSAKSIKNQLMYKFYLCYLKKHEYRRAADYIYDYNVIQNLECDNNEKCQIYREILKLCVDISDFKLAKIYQKKYSELCLRIGYVEGINHCKTIQQEIDHKNQPQESVKLMPEPINYNSNVKSLEYHLYQGYQYCGTGQYNESVEHYMKSLSLALELKDNEMVSNIHGFLANVFILTRNYRASLVHQNKNLAVVELKNDLHATANAYKALSMTRTVLKQYEQAVIVTGKYYIICREIGDNNGVETAKKRMNYCRKRMNLPEMSDEEISLSSIGPVNVVQSNQQNDHQSSSIEENLTSANQMWRMRNEEVLRFYGDKKYGKAIEGNMANILYARDTLRNKQAEIESMINLGLCYTATKNYDQAIYQNECAYHLAKKINDNDFIISSFYCLKDNLIKKAQSVNEENEGNYRDEVDKIIDKGVVYLIQRLKFIKQYNVNCKSKLDWYNEYGQFIDAVVLLSKILERAKKVDSNELQIEMHMELGKTFRNLKQYETSVKHYKDAFNLTFVTKNRIIRADICNKLHEVYYESSNYDDAIQSLVECLYICNMTYNILGKFVVYENLIKVFITINDFKSALKYANELKKFHYHLGNIETAISLNTKIDALKTLLLNKEKKTFELHKKKCLV